MATTFQERQKEKYLLFGAIVLILITFFIFWNYFSAEEKLSTSFPVKEIFSERIKRIEINFEILKHPFFEKLQPLEPIPPLEIEVGRDNPFTEYSLSIEEISTEETSPLESETVEKTSGEEIPAEEVFPIGGKVIEENPAEETFPEGAEDVE